MATAQFDVRISLKDADIVARGLQSLGKEGEEALKRIQQASQPATAGLAALDQAAQAVGGGIGEFASRAGVLGEALSLLGPAGIAAAAGIGVITVALGAGIASAKNSIDVFGKLSDQADQIGLSAESLQELEFGFRTIGVEGEKLTTALIRLSDTVGSVMQRGQEAPKQMIDAFERLGISVSQVSKFGGDMDTMLRLISDGMQDVETRTERAAIAHDLFGRSGERLLPILEQGGSALDDIAEKAHEAGAVLEEDGVKRWGDFEDAIQNAEQVLNVASARIFPEFGEGLKKTSELTAELLTKVADFTDSIREMISTLSTSLGENNILKEILDDVLKIHSPIIALLGFLDKIPEVVGSAKSAIESVAGPPFAVGGKLAAALPGQTPSKTSEETQKQSARATASLIFNTGEQFGSIQVQDEMQKWPDDNAKSPIGKPVSSGRKGEKAPRGGGGRAAPKEPDFAKLGQMDLETSFGFDLSPQVQKAQEAFDKIVEANAQAHGKIIQVMEMRRDKEISNLGAIGLKEEQLAEARKLINDTTATEIAQKQEDVSNRILEANLNAHGKIIEVIELRRDIELKSLEQIGFSEEELAKNRSRVVDTANQEIIAAQSRTAKPPELSDWDKSLKFMSDFSDRLTSVDGMAQGVITGIANIGSTASSAFADAIVAGEDFGATMEALGKTIEKMLIQMALQMAMQAAIGGGFGGLASLFGGGGGAGYGSTGAGSAMTSGGTNPGFLLGGAAHGAAFESGNVVPFARGGIVDRPTVFPMAGGMGLMGEAGPEAVIPLRRSSSGELGVSSPSPNVSINIINKSESKVSASPKPDGRGGLSIDVLVDAVEAAMAQRMTRPGTMLNRSLAPALNPVKAR